MIPGCVLHREGWRERGTTQIVVLFACTEPYSQVSVFRDWPMINHTFEQVN